MTDKISKDYIQTIARLKFLSTIVENDKIDTKNILIESSNIFTPFKRLFNRESRSSTLSFVRTIIYDSFDVFNSNINERVLCLSIINDLIASIKGLQSLQKTYENDKMMVCELECLIDFINLNIDNIKEKYPDLKQ